VRGEGNEISFELIETTAGDGVLKGSGGVHDGAPGGEVAGENSWYQYRIVKSTKSINYLIFKAILPLPSSEKLPFSTISAQLCCAGEGMKPCWIGIKKTLSKS
jgi:hypothetical protein